MDPQVGDSEATDEARVVVDAPPGPGASAGEGADGRSDADLRGARGGRKARAPRHPLSPGMHAVDDRTGRVGWIGAPEPYAGAGGRLGAPPTDPGCAYRGAARGVTPHMQDNENVRVTSSHGSGVTHGTLRIKGRFGHQHVQNRG